MIQLDGSASPVIYCCEESISLVTVALHKIGKSETLSLIRQHHKEHLSRHGDAVEIHFINQGFSNTVVLRLSVGSVRGGQLVPHDHFILKAGRWEDVSREVENYRSLIQPASPSLFPKMFGFRDLLKRWASVLYQDLGEVATFQDLYIQSDDPQDSARHLDQLFRSLETLWYREARIAKTNMFSVQFNLQQSIRKYEDAIRSLVASQANRETVEVIIGKKAHQFSNPLFWLHAHTQETDTVTHVSTVHGDMHGANILVDRDRSTVHLIDFANMQGDGHIFKDHVKLEANILFRLFDFDVAEATEDFHPDWLRFFAASLGYQTAPERTSELSKAEICIQTIRRRASALKQEFLASPSPSWEFEYLTGLLHWTLSSIYWIDIHPSKKRFAFYAACLICAAIDQVKAAHRVLLVSDCWTQPNGGHAEPCAAPNDGPATPSANPGVTKGPSSVS